MPDGEEYVPESTIIYEFDAANYAKVTGDRIFLNVNPFAVNMYADRKPRINDFVRSRRKVIEEAVTLTLPQGYVVESIPNTSEIINPFGSFRTQVSQDDGKINIICGLKRLSTAKSRFSNIKVVFARNQPDIFIPSSY